jgi:hypothetical protein
MPSNGAIATVTPRQIPTSTFSADNYVSESYPRYAGTHLGINTDYIVAELSRQRLHPVLLSSHSDPCPQLRHRCCMLHLILQLLFSRRKLHFRPCNSFLRRLRIYNSRILNILIRTNSNVATVITTEGNTCTSYASSASATASATASTNATEFTRSTTTQSTASESAVITKSSAGKVKIKWRTSVAVVLGILLAITLFQASL